MTHHMRLVNFAYEAIKNKTKDIEVRLNDEKRQLIKVGDIIEFEHLDTKEIMKVLIFIILRLLKNYLAFFLIIG